MNFHLADSALPILKVMVINPLVRSSRLLIVKISSGSVFGIKQLVDVIFLVYSNETVKAEAFKLELISCAFPCLHSIIISSELPSITDADVFCFITNFKNPNSLDFNKLDSNEVFDTFYLIIKIAHNFARLSEVDEEPEGNAVKARDKVFLQEKKAPKPIIVADGLVAIDILHHLAQNIPHDVFFCPTPHIAASRSIIADKLKMQCNKINTPLIWAANDLVFNVEIEKSLAINDVVEKTKRCGWDLNSDKLFSSVVADHTQFSPSWMKIDLIEKVTQYVDKNPYGAIYKALEISRILRVIWNSRSNKTGTPFCYSFGVISDGSLETKKGLPYVLPVILSKDSWTSYKRFAYDAHARQEVKRITTATMQHHTQLIPYCKKFLKDNVINQAFVAVDDESESIYSLLQQSSRLT